MFKSTLLHVIAIALHQDGIKQGNRKKVLNVNLVNNQVLQPQAWQMIFAKPEQRFFMKSNKRSYCQHSFHPGNLK